MEITEVRIKLMEEASERLQAFCSITFDNCFVIRDLKIIDGTNGPFVAMPSRKLTAHCPQCGCKNHLARRALQPVRRPAGRRSPGQGRRRPRQALRRHRPSDQLGLPRDDPGARDSRVSGGTGPLEAARLPARPTTTTIRRTRSCRPRTSAAAATREKTQVQPAEPQPRSPHKLPATDHRAAHRVGRTRAKRDGFGAGFLKRDEFRQPASSASLAPHRRVSPCDRRRVRSRSRRPACRRRGRIGARLALLPKITALRLHITGRGVWLRILPFARSSAKCVPARRESHAQATDFVGSWSVGRGSPAAA